MKMNWGWGIAFFYIGFVLAVIVLVIAISSQKWDLTEQDYYSKGVKYQSQVRKIENASLLPQKPAIKYEKPYFFLYLGDIFKNSKISGSIYFYRASDKDLDFVIPLNPDSSMVQKVDMSGKSHGFWKVKLSWGTDENEYLIEEELIIK